MGILCPCTRTQSLLWRRYFAILGWFEHNSAKRTQKVGQKSPNSGLYDMSGNVWEWCWDSWIRDYTDVPQRILYSYPPPDLEYFVMDLGQTLLYGLELTSGRNFLPSKFKSRFSILANDGLSNLHMGKSLTFFPQCEGIYDLLCKLFSRRL